MYVRALSLTDFRSWPQVDVVLRPGVNVFVGPNGVGKTNLMEALAYLATLSSHRVATDAPMVRRGASRAVVRAAVVHDGRELTVEVEIGTGRANRARVNRSAVSRPRDVLGILRTVLFAPEDLALVRGDPDQRRRFLDELLVARAPRYAGVRAEYDKVLRQRAALLKTAGPARRAGPGGAELATLDVWDGHLARHGAQLLAGRLALVAELTPLVRSGYASIAPESTDATIRYRSGSPVAGAPDGDRIPTPEELEAALLEALSAARKQELERGVCLVGPHRDDLELLLGDGPAKGYASHGECWSLALALRLASFELLRADGAEPVLVLDDVFAELDTRRRGALAEVAASAEQVLITAAVPQDVPAELAGIRFDVHDGAVRIHD